MDGFLGYAIAMAASVALVVVIYKFDELRARDKAARSCLEQIDRIANGILGNKPNFDLHQSRQALDRIGELSGAYMRNLRTDNFVRQI